MYPPIEPYEHGMLDVGDGDRVYWETCGNPDGKPALMVHGGPGSGCSPNFRRLFDPRAYRVVLFDQRNCGRSNPHAGRPEIDLSRNTTQNLVADMERLRKHLEVERWLVLGGSWGATLGLAYAEAHAERVSEMVLAGVTTGRCSETDWLFRGGLAALFPGQWERLLGGLPEGGRDDVPAGYSRLLHNADADVRRRAAEAWCLWESASPDWPPVEGMSPRFQDPAYALCFARIVTHYVRHDLFLEDGALLRNARRLAAIPGLLINGRYDLQAPIGNAWALRRAWPGAELVVVDNAGHSADDAGIRRELVRATDRFAATTA